MSTQDIVQKLWNLCNVLRDDGITYHQYVTELTYILFLKMISETETEEKLIAIIKDNYKHRVEEYCNDNNKDIDALSNKERENLKIELDRYSWKYLNQLNGLELKRYYNAILSELGGNDLPEEIRKIFTKAVSNIEEPKNLEKIISEINKLEWFEAREEGLGNLYEGLLEKNANEKKQVQVSISLLGY